MSSYARFLKDSISNKRKLEEYEIVALTENCSVTIQNKLPAKLKDLKSCSFPCLIRNVYIHYSFYDLGLSVSLMPLFMCEKLDL